MAERGFTKDKPKGLKQWFYGTPKWLFRARLGFLFGKRFALLEHIGRTSGNVHQTPLEVVTHSGDRYVVASGWGASADWYQNLQAHPAHALWVGARRYEVEQELLNVEQGSQELAAYKENHPGAAKALWAGMGIEQGASDQEAAEAIPTVALELSR